MSVGTISVFPQGIPSAIVGSCFCKHSKLFELAGKRGYRIESGGYGTQPDEAAFEEDHPALRSRTRAISGVSEYQRLLDAAKLLGARQTFHKPFAIEELLSAVRFELAH